MSQPTPDSKTSIQVIERMMRLLDALAAHSDPVSLKELAQRTELHPSTAHRILNDMGPAASSTAPIPARTGSACGCSSSAIS